MAKRKAPSRVSKKDAYDLDHLLTSDKSKLIDIDLHGTLADFFSDPDNWAQVSAEDKDFIRNLLPPHVELTDDGSIPNDFWKYNPEFRLDCRNLQEDLRAGRMNPEWQSQAHQAMEERATGAFDNFKEREFEQYWGQKQKVDWKYLAGDASKIKLEELLDAGLFKEGDIWSFDHTFGRGDEAVEIQKECKIVQINGKSVTFAIPPGQLKFARRFDHPPSEPGNDQATTPPQSDIPEVTANTVPDDVKMQESLSTIESPYNVLEPTSLVDRSKVSDHGEDLSGVTAETKAEEGKPDILVGDETQTSSTTATRKTDVEPVIPTAPSTPKRMPMESSTQSSSPLSDIPDIVPAASDPGVIHFTTSTLWPLEKKIIEIDGRLPSSMRTASAWRDIRCRRNEQDMGSLFEMRDEYYAYQVAGRDRSPRKGKRS
ncbi:MAG: hypothetical protein Q9226_003350 [Calogaya cf. arnoldii]